MYLIGLTGGIASGKSVVAKRLADLGAVHIDADRLARQVVEPGTPALKAIREKFGSDVIRSDGTLDRTRLAAIVFADPSRRAQLNAIVHPAVRELGQHLIDEAQRRDPDAVVVYDVPLLAEAADRFDFDLIVVVHADAETRIRRLIEHRGMSRQDAVLRQNAQATDSERLSIADVVIDNNGTRQSTEQQVDELWRTVSESKLKLE